MSVLLWILIGLAAGLAMTMVMPDLRPRPASGSARRLLAGAAVGVLGALAGGYGLWVIGPAARDDGLVMSCAALAGALWLAWGACVMGSRRRRGEGADRGARVQLAYATPTTVTYGTSGETAAGVPGAA